MRKVICEVIFIYKEKMYLIKFYIFVRVEIKRKNIISYIVYFVCLIKTY